MKLQIGDYIIRNERLAIYPEDVCPLDIDFEKVYQVLAVHSRTIFDNGKFISYQTIETEIGEISACLVQKVVT